MLLISLHTKFKHYVLSQDDCVDSRGFPGWDAVDNLAAYLITLDTTKTALSNEDAVRIVELYNKLCNYDKSPTKYASKSKRSVLTGPWRASRKRMDPLPGVQASERYML